MGFVSHGRDALDEKYKEDNYIPPDALCLTFQEGDLKVCGISITLMIQKLSGFVIFLPRRF
ncbi:MAG: hypothetical protein A2Y88_10955 [Chloroflexi bacterium RBG_13_48_10]|nr:MAG: hypothetical protein A2Y88_10955 [Chloroflexi bacterium RBG_13_48_10]